MQECSSRPSIPGTLTRSGGSDTIISSGIASLDDVLGDGIPTGSLVVIDEDTQGLYSRVLLKYFLAEGIVNKHDVFVASQEIPPEKLIQQLPMLMDSNPSEDESTEDPKGAAKRKMKIAFRYDSLPTDRKDSDHRFGHYYDLSGVMPAHLVNDCRVVYWNGADPKPNSTIQPTQQPATHNRKYHDLLLGIRDELRRLDDQSNVLRIGVQSLGSPLWQGYAGAEDRRTVLDDINRFLYGLRMMVQRKRAIAYVTIPVHLLERYERCLHLSDIYIRLKAFSGTELADNKYLSDYHGFFYIDKVAARNEFKSKQISSVEYVFKLRRKKFILKTLHLPPDVDTSEGAGHGMMSCGSGTKLDF